MRKAVTIYDIAKEAGVSPATVSRVLTGKAKVSKEKREKIEQAIYLHDYKPNALARSLRETKSRVIGMVLVDFMNPFYATLLSACEKEARRRGYSLIVTGTLGDRALEDTYLDTMYEQRVAAIIMVGGRTDDLVLNNEYVKHIKRIEKKVPMVIGGVLDGTDCCKVCLEESKAAELAVEYLIRLGHRKIAFIGGDSSIRSTVEKRQKYMQILREKGISVEKDWIVDGNSYDDKSGYDAMNQILTLTHYPTAIIAVNDFTAAGAIHAILEGGFSIPEDFSLISFDNTYISDLCYPKLTSVSYNIEIFGKRLIDSAIDIVEGKEIAQQQIIQPELVIRDSCRAIN